MGLREYEFKESTTIVMTCNFPIFQQLFESLIFILMH